MKPRGSTDHFISGVILCHLLNALVPEGTFVLFNEYLITFVTKLASSVLFDSSYKEDKCAKYGFQTNGKHHSFSLRM